MHFSTRFDRIFEILFGVDFLALVGDEEFHEFDGIV
jgi:hypothetical protein